MATPRICSVSMCDKPAHGFGLCLRHYSRWERHGDPEKGGTAHGSISKWISVHVSYDEQACLTWPFSRSKNGYGTFRKDGAKGKNSNASRVMCEMAHGPPPIGKPFALHSCGNGRIGCVSPAHLRWGTPKENSEDARQHGTLLQGEMSPKSKLKEADVREIRASTESRTTLATRFGVQDRYITKVRNGAAWRCVP